MTPAALVLLTLTICAVTPAGTWGDGMCDDLEVRARSCAEAQAWARAWIPPGHAVMRDECVEQRQASR